MAKMTSSATVTVGARFIRTGQPWKVFTVIRIFERPPMLPHARLMADNRDRDETTIAVNVLLDRRYFVPAA